jgi:opacity protein-like surface antigen
MRQLLIVITLFLLATTAAAQNTVSVSILHPQFSSVSASADGESIPVGLDSRTGFAIEAAHKAGRLAFGMSASRFNAPASASLGADRVGVGSLALMPVTADMTYQGNAGRVAPYIGAGIAYVTTGNLHSNTLGSIAVGNDFTYNVKAGLDVALSPRVAINLGARYMPVSVSAIAGGEPSGRLKFNTLTIGAGLQWSF